MHYQTTAPLQAPTTTDARRAAALVAELMSRHAAQLEHPPAGVRALGASACMSWHLERVTTTARAGWNPKSGNRKLGRSAAFTTDRTTCPHTCPLRATARDEAGDHAARIAAGEKVRKLLHGCYADGGPLSWYWDKLTRGDAGGTWADTCRQVAASQLPPGMATRLFQAGDMPTTPAGQVDWHAVAALAYALVLAGATPGRTWGYTHHAPGPRLVAILEELQRIAGAVVVLSANDAAHAAELRAAYPSRPVATLVAEDQAPGALEIAGERVAVCPAQLTEHRATPVTCATCGGARGPLCARGTGAPVIGFRAHGSAKARAAQVAAGGEGVPA